MEPNGWTERLLLIKDRKMSLSHQSCFSHRRRHAFTLVEIMVVIAIIGLLCAVAIPNWVRARANSQASACINNLKKIDDAASQFAIEMHKSTGDHVSLNRDLTPYIKMNSAGRLPACPASGVYGIESVGDTPVCSLGSVVNPPHIMP